MEIGLHPLDKPRGLYSEDIFEGLLLRGVVRAEHPGYTVYYLVEGEDHGAGYLIDPLLRLLHLQAHGHGPYQVLDIDGLHLIFPRARDHHNWGEPDGVCEEVGEPVLAAENNGGPEYGVLKP